MPYLKSVLLLFLITASQVGAESSSSSNGCQDNASCDDNNPCTLDFCNNGACKYLNRAGYILGCNDRGSPTDCTNFYCKDGACIPDTAQNGEMCLRDEITPIGSGSCAGKKACTISGKCRGGVCRPINDSVTTCNNFCGSGGGTDSEGNRICCSSTSDCSQFSGCGDVCTIQEDQDERCCTLNSGQKIACPIHTVCNPECGCIEPGTPCPKGSPSSQE